MAVDSDADTQPDSRIELDDPARALVELAARDGPLCATCLAAPLPIDRLRVSDLVGELADEGYLQETDVGLYEPTERAEALVRGVDAGP